MCEWHGTQPAGYDAPALNTGPLHKKIHKAKDQQRYLITAAQNATAVHKPFFASLQTYCRINEAQLIVIPYRYKNPTSIWSKVAENDDWWAPELTPFLLDRRTKLCKGLVLLADIKTQPTASRPLTGFENITGGDSGIIGHPKIELLTVATPQHKMAKLLTTTGAITVPNYLPGKAGKQGEFHHSFGACVAEISEGVFHLRQVIATRDGSFQDLNWNYGGDSRTPAVVEAIVLGDIHVECVAPDVVSATFTDKNSLVKTLRPKHLVFHDLHDGYARSHHHVGNPFIEFAKHKAGVNDVEKALDETFAFVDQHSPSACKNIIVASNHNEVLARWVREANPKADPVNVLFWAETFKAMMLGSAMGAGGAEILEPFAYWGERKLKCSGRTKFLKRNESLRIKGIEVGFHGDIGAGGSRGSRKGYSRIGTKTVIGHSHTPGITEGAYQCGTSSRLGLEYNNGPSSWMNTHCLIYANGKRTLVNIIKGTWRA